ncbi:phosphotransferase [Pseudofulvimonas gallinarii]|jgi:RIO-like serine/threonine protein kinase|uniref:Serine/threonine protein kinase n=2 Tax=Pseudofulvimonas gallinarii TaxID=634155 RepID=A0A4R3L4T4_9GAMM|nr:phosphotransferase [Pseudofulvimonas gallinarii]TCS94362.1 serine/threonine protein kinase [Pseudofulvimonas gallinarii]THD14692.1 serine/threonine protein kinase [Pseudofulvimonas gallinarii]
MMTETLLKRDAFGAIYLCHDGSQGMIRRDLAQVSWWLRPLASRAAAREARVLRRLEGIDGVPALLSASRLRVERSLIPGKPMQEGQPRDPGYFRRAHRLLRELRARGVVHNDLAKEPNWLVRDDGSPAIVDFQIAGMGDTRARWFRLLAREDLRHLLKHKRTYCPEALTPVEKRLLARSSWLARTWRRTGKRVYNWVTRRILRWQDNEGRG